MDLRAALETRRAKLADRRKEYVRGVFANFVRLFGEDLMHGTGQYEGKSVYNSGHYTLFGEVLAPVTNQRPSRNGGAILLVEAAVEADAQSYATAVIEAWIAKIESKVGELENGECFELNWSSFRITGTRGGHKVAIEQQIIVNFSSLGNPYNQFPARVYVDGKAISAAAFKKMMAAEIAPAAPATTETATEIAPAPEAAPAAKIEAGSKVQIKMRRSTRRDRTLRYYDGRSGVVKHIAGGAVTVSVLGRLLFIGLADVVLA